MNENQHSDDEILAGVRRRLAGAEPLIPQPPALEPAFTESARMRPRVVVSSRFGFGGFAPLVLIAVLVVVAVGVGLGSQAFSGGGSGGSAPSHGNNGFGMSFQLVHPAGTEVTGAELDATKAVLIKRAESLGATSYSVNEAPPDGITVWLEGVADTAEVRTLIGQTGHLEFVPLPPETYGTSIAQGQKQLPSTGGTIDPSLPAQFTGADLDLGAISAAVDTSMSPRAWVVNFAFKEAAATAFETWSGQHINEYLAIVLDGKVLSVPYIKSTIVGGKGQISGAFTAQSAQELATVLRSGWLPYPLRDVWAYGPSGSPDAESGVPIESGVPLPSGMPIESGVPMESSVAAPSGVPLHSGVPSAIESPSAVASS